MKQDPSIFAFILHPSAFLLAFTARQRALVVERRRHNFLKPQENARFCSAYWLLSNFNDNVSMPVSQCPVRREHYEKSRLFAHSLFAFTGYR